MGYPAGEKQSQDLNLESLTPELVPRPLGWAVCRFLLVLHDNQETTLRLLAKVALFPDILCQAWARPWAMGIKGRVVPGCWDGQGLGGGFGRRSRQ